MIKARMTPVEPGFIYTVACIVGPLVMVVLRVTDGEPLLSWETALWALIGLLAGLAAGWVCAKIFGPKQTSRPGR